MNLLLFNLRTDRQDTALGFTTDWINELAKHFDRVTVLTMYRGTLAVADNVEVFSAGLEEGLSKPRRVARFYVQLARALMRRPDVCFAHMMPLFLVMAAPILKLRGIPSVLWYAHNHRSHLLPLATKACDMAIASTKSAFPLETPKLRVVGQGIDTGRFRPREGAAPPGLHRVFTVGRLSRVKNLDMMIRAAKALATARPEFGFRLDLIGEPLTPKDKEYVEECKALSRLLGIEKKVNWLAPVTFDRVDEVYREGGIFLSANDNGLDKAILEAMACGLPVIAMHSALIEPLGKCFAPNETRFARALIELSELDLSSQKVMGEQLRTYIEREHGLPRLGKTIADLLAELAK